MKTYEDDLQYVADKVSDSLNIFSETAVCDNRMVAMYGYEEFIALFATPQENNPEKCSLRLRTKDMAATWNNVPLGFSKINNSKGLLHDMRKAAHVSLKRNSIWYIDRQIQDVVGDRVVFSELTTKKGYLYKIAFTNGFVTYLSLVQADGEYYKPHDEAQLFFIVSKNKEPLGPPMTADECIMMLVNVAMQTNMKVSEFISVAEQNGGKTLISHSYRTEKESVDEVKVVFSNGYAMRLEVMDENITVELIGKTERKAYTLDVRKFDKIEDVYLSIKEISMLPQYIKE